MSEEQLKPAETEAVKEEEEVEEISEDDLEGVTGGQFAPEEENPPPTLYTCCGHDPCLGPEAGCNSETTAD